MRERQRLTTVWIKDTLGPQLEKVCVSASGPSARALTICACR